MNYMEKTLQYPLGHEIETSLNSIESYHSVDRLKAVGV